MSCRAGVEAMGCSSVVAGVQGAAGGEVGAGGAVVFWRCGGGSRSQVVCHVVAVVA